MATHICAKCGQTKPTAAFYHRDKTCGQCREDGVRAAAAANRGKALSIPGDDVTSTA
jgi:recombinational DNA repair protein (RecF pathway)